MTNWQNSKLKVFSTAFDPPQLHFITLHALENWCYVCDKWLSAARAIWTTLSWPRNNSLGPSVCAPDWQKELNLVFSVVSIWPECSLLSLKVAHFYSHKSSSCSAFAKAFRKKHPSQVSLAYLWPSSEHSLLAGVETGHNRSHLGGPALS